MNKIGNKIQTVLGIIDGADLGFCHCHEHLFIKNGKPAMVNPSLRIDDFNKTLNELNIYKSVGGGSLVDAQPVGCGRMENALAQASRLSGVNIIASTGFHKLAFYPKNHWINKLNEVQLTDLFIDEINNGMFTETEYDLPTNKTIFKAGIIKVAADAQGIIDANKKLFYAAANACKQTGISILCHTEYGKYALDIIEFFLNQGVKESSIIICHIDRTLMPDLYYKKIAETGVYMELDTIGRYKYHSDLDEVELIKKLIKWGFEDKILLGLDTTRERLISYGGIIGLSYIKNHFIPIMINNGIKKIHIKKMMIKNPQNALSIKKY